MRVKVARRGPNPGGEFWGCNAFRTRNCRGTHDVPRQEWDWFGFVRIPVSIIRNAHGLHYREIEDFFDYERGADGIIGGYDDFDHDMAYFEQSMEAENRYWDNINAAEIDQVLNDNAFGYSLASKILEAARRFGLYGQSREAIAFAITENFAGSARRKMTSLTPDYPEEREYGVVYLDDGSALGFNRTTLGVQMLNADGEFLSTMLRADDFTYIAEYFSKNFGAHAQASVNYL